MTTYMTLPRVLSDHELDMCCTESDSYDFLMAVRAAIPLAPRPAASSSLPVGNVTVPTLFVCGENDPYLLCTSAGAKATRNYVSAPYTYFSARCGHSLLSVGAYLGGCTNQAVRLSVMEAITSFLDDNSSPPPAPPFPWLAPTC